MKDTEIRKKLICDYIMQMEMPPSYAEYARINFCVNGVVDAQTILKEKMTYERMFESLVSRMKDCKRNCL